MTKLKIKDGLKKRKQNQEIDKQTIPVECEGYKGSWGNDPNTYSDVSSDLFMQVLCGAVLQALIHTYIQVVRLKCFEESTVHHCVLAKEHSVREKCNEKPESQTVFVRSIPPFVEKEALINAFGCFGKIKEVYLHPAPTASAPPVNSSKFFNDVPPILGFKVAYIVFAKEDGARKAILASSTEPLILFPKDQSSTSVLDKWNQDYNNKVTMDWTELRKDVDDYMASYDKNKKKEEDLEKAKQEEEEADDGWVTVTRKSGIPRKESVHKRIMKKQDDKLKKTQLLNFYKFQIRESKMNQLVRLREKFEEDKKRIAQLKESRKFKPF